MIKKLDNKYLVLKWDDVEKLQLNDFLGATALCNKVKAVRRENGKSVSPEYVVLNLDDKIDIDYFMSKQSPFQLTDKQIEGFEEIGVKSKPHRIIEVADIAIDLVNAILKAKGA